MPDVFHGLAEWFESTAAKGVGALGFCAGKRDTADRLAGAVHAWLIADRCRSVAYGYVNGIAARGSGLPERWVALLDDLATSNAEPAVLITSTADVGSRGFERIIRSLDHLSPPTSRFLQLFGYGGWHGELTVEQQRRVLEVLVRLAEGGDVQAPGVGMNLISFWWHGRTPPLDKALAPSAIRLAVLAPSTAHIDNDYHWQQTLRLLCPHEPVQVAAVVVGVLTGPINSWRFDEETVAVLRESARLAPERVMEVIGGAILDRERRSAFGVHVYHGLFEAIGVDAVKRWVDMHGRENLRWIARHLASPRS